MSLDINNDGVVSRSEMRKAFETVRFLEADFGVDKFTPPEELTMLYMIQYFKVLMKTKMGLFAPKRVMSGKEEPVWDSPKEVLM